MKIAIVGAGLAGLSTAWFLMNSNPAIKIALYDCQDNKASTVAAGLMHPFPGKKALKVSNAEEKMSCTLQLVNIAKKELGYHPIIQKGLFRVASDEEQKHNFSECAKNYDEVKWINGDQCGIFIKNAYAIDIKSYLYGLLKSLLSTGLCYRTEKINDLDKLKDFDIIILACGAGILHFTFDEKLPLQALKGQALIYPYPSHFQKLAYSINSKAYIVMRPCMSSCYVGATFERGNADNTPDMEYAKKKLIPLIKPIMPKLAKLEPIDCVSGIRITAPNHQPMIKKVDEKVFIFSGLGSKGLLNHAYFAKQLVSMIGLPT